MIAIADGGSTKCDWILFDRNGSSRVKIRTRGLNPSMLKRKEIENRLYASAELCDLRNLVSEVHFYGAGCGTLKFANFLKGNLAGFFEHADPVNVKGDLTGAVYSCTAEPGLVAILGTGSNCCFFNGRDIEVRMPSMGYSLMDDASGNYLGKQVLRAYYFKQLPPMLESLFESNYKLKPDKVKKNLYKKDYPNAYLASFAPFVLENQQHPFMNDLLRSALRTFIDTHLSFYKEEYKMYPVHFVGSVAYHSRDVLREILKERGITPGRFVRRPVDGLWDYHRSDY